MSYELIDVSIFSGNASVPIWKSLSGSVLKLFLLLLSPAALSSDFESQELLANNKDLKFPFFKFVGKKIIILSANNFHERMIGELKKKIGVCVKKV